MLPEQVRQLSSSRRRFRMWKSRAASVAIGMAAYLPSRGSDALSIFNYHRVHPLPGIPLSITPAAFRRHIAGLLRAGYQPCRISDYLNLSPSDQETPTTRFCVTFDDAYQNVVEYAAPILRELGVPATAFLTTGHVGASSFPFDPLVYGEQGRFADPTIIQPITREGCQQLLDDGWELGGHTHTHQNFSGRPGLLAEELDQSAEWLHENFSIDAPSFAFPYGNTDTVLREIVRSSAFTCALTTESRVVRPGSDPFGWGRFGGEDYDTAAAQVAKASGWYSLARDTWRQLAYGERPLRAHRLSPTASGAAQ